MKYLLTTQQVDSLRLASAGKVIFGVMDSSDIDPTWLAANSESLQKFFPPIKPTYFRRVLRQMGLLSTIDGALAIPGNEDKKIAFDYTLSFIRNDAELIEMGAALGLTNSQIDAIFEAALALQIAAPAD